MLVIMPSALNLPQSNPTTVLEYAPVPPEDEDEPPPQEGSLSSLSLGTSDTIETGGLKDEARPVDLRQGRQARSSSAASATRRGRPKTRTRHRASRSSKATTAARRSAASPRTRSTSSSTATRTMTHGRRQRHRDDAAPPARSATSTRRRTTRTTSAASTDEGRGPRQRAGRACARRSTSTSASRPTTGTSTSTCTGRLHGGPGGQAVGRPGHLRAHQAVRSHRLHDLRRQRRRSSRPPSSARSASTAATPSVPNKIYQENAPLPVVVLAGRRAPVSRCTTTTCASASRRSRWPHSGNAADHGPGAQVRPPLHDRRGVRRGSGSSRSSRRQSSRKGCPNGAEARHRRRVHLPAQRLLRSTHTPTRSARRARTSPGCRTTASRPSSGCPVTRPSTARPQMPPTGYPEWVIAGDGSNDQAEENSFQNDRTRGHTRGR